MSFTVASGGHLTGTVLFSCRISGPTLMGNQNLAPLFGNFEQNNPALFHCRGRNSGLVVKKYAASDSNPGLDLGVKNRGSESLYGQGVPIVLKSYGRIILIARSDFGRKVNGSGSTTQVCSSRARQ